MPDEQGVIPCQATSSGRASGSGASSDSESEGGMEEGGMSPAAGASPAQGHGWPHQHLAHHHTAAIRHHHPPPGTPLGCGTLPGGGASATAPHPYHCDSEDGSGFGEGGAARKGPGPVPSLQVLCQQAVASQLVEPRTCLQVGVESMSKLQAHYACSRTSLLRPTLNLPLTHPNTLHTQILDLADVAGAALLRAYCIAVALRNLDAVLLESSGALLALPPHLVSGL